ASTFAWNRPAGESPRTSRRSVHLHGGNVGSTTRHVASVTTGKCLVWADLDPEGARIARQIHEAIGGRAQPCRMAPAELFISTDALDIVRMKTGSGRSDGQEWTRHPRSGVIRDSRLTASVRPRFPHVRAAPRYRRLRRLARAQSRPDAGALPARSL